MTPAQTSAFLAALSAECAAMVRTVEGLSDVVAEHARRAPPEARAGALVQAQAIDALSQQLDALRGLTCALSRGDAVEAAVDGVLLADLSDRLRQALFATPPASTAAAPVAGDLMLFD